MILKLPLIIISSLYLFGCAGSNSIGIDLTENDSSVYEENASLINSSSIIALSNSSNSPSTSTGSGSWKLLSPSVSQVSLSASASSVYDNGSNITITATASQIANSDITVVIGTSGTATEGTDYANVSNITISAGSTTGTAVFNPTADDVNEGSETAVIAISSLSGGALTVGSALSVTITINEFSLRTGTAFNEGSTSAQNAIKAETQWTNVDYAQSTSSVHPYEQMNIHKVQSFSDGTNNLTGIGQFIHIADFYCDDDHLVYANKTVHNLDDGGSGESAFADATSSNYHCQFVASMAAGDGTGNGDGTGENLISGVAPDADLILSSIPNYSGYALDDYAADLDTARGHGAVASNNSWGYTDNTDGNANATYNVTEFQALRDANPSYSLNQLFAYKTSGATSQAAVTASQSYVTALNNFQNNGVIVFASGNYNGESDVSMIAGLPEFYPQLDEAWVSVGLVDFTGNSIANASESDFTLYGNKCGSAKEYCVVADGYQLNGGQFISGDTHYYKTNGSGSSYSAPMVSGGIALLAQAFPNHTPEQLTDRLLASANNSWFTPQGNTTFTSNGNSITHGYHSTWGQGLPDFYAALSPITSNINPAMALYTGSSIRAGDARPLSSSYLLPSASFGNALSQGLVGKIGYAYDVLSGGFKYDISKRINTTNYNTPTISLFSEMPKLDSHLESLNNSNWKQDFTKVLSTPSKTDSLETIVTLGSSSLPVQSFFGSNFHAGVDLSNYQVPYLEEGEGGLGLSANYQFANSRLLVGVTTPIKINNLKEGEIGSRKSLITSLELGNPLESTLTLMTGITQDKDNLLGTTGNDAYSILGSKSNTLFAAFKAQNHISNNLTLTGLATIAKTDMSSPTNSFINSASNVKSSSVGLIATQKNIIGEDSFSLSISQPNRVSKGGMSIRLSNLAEADGSLSYRDSNINLSPSGRQIVYGFSYQKDLDKGIGFSLKHLLTSNLNHNQDSALVSSSYVGLKYKDLKVGYNINSQDSSKNTQLSYQHSF